MKRVKTLAACLFVCSFTFILGVARAEVHGNVFTGTIALDGDISDFFESTGALKSGVCLSNDPAGAIAGVPGSDGLGEPPLAPTTTKDGLFHPSGFNQRRVMSAYNPNINGGTIYVGIDLPGGTGSLVNPDYADSLIPVRGSIRPFDADANGEPQTIGRKAGGANLETCPDAVAGDTVDVLNCESTDSLGFTDDATDNGVAESYAVTISFTNGIAVTAALIEDNFSPAGSARIQVTQTAGKTFGAMASVNGSGVPQGFDVEFAIINVNANVDACTRLRQEIAVDSGSNRDGVANGEDHNDVVCEYLLQPVSVSCQVLFLTNNVQITTNLCDSVSANAGVLLGTSVELRVVVCAAANNAQNVTNITVSIPGVGDVTVAGPLAAGQCATVSVGSVSCDVSGAQGFMASVSGLGQISADCLPVQSTCSATLECCGMPTVQVIKQIACVLNAGACGAFGKSATGVKDDAIPAFCYSITVTNTGNVGLHGITVVDDVLGDLSSSFADALSVRTSETHIFTASHDTDTMNTVIVNGEGDFGTGHVMSSDNANAFVIQASIACEKRVSSPDDLDGNANDSHVTLRADGNSHDVTYSVTVMAGNADLANVVISDAALGCTLPPGFSLAANTSTNINLCTVPTTCDGVGAFTNTISITADIDTSHGNCGFNAEGQHIHVDTSCSAVVVCLPCPTVTVNSPIVCTNVSAQLCATVSGGSGIITAYNWTGPNGFTATGQCINVTAAGEYCVTVTDANGCVSAPGCGTLTVNPVPACDITGDDTICAGQTTAFCGPAGLASYSWTGPNGFTAHAQCTGPISAAGQYSLTIVAANGCSNTCSRTLIVFQLPVCNITGNNAICPGGSTEFCGPAGLSYLWSGPEDNGATSQCITISTAGAYTLRVVDANGCTNSCQRTLSVNPVPTCQISGAAQVCVGTTNTYTASSSLLGSHFSWEISGDGSILPPRNGDSVRVVATGPGGFTLTVTVSKDGCTSTCQKTVTAASCRPCIHVEKTIACAPTPDTCGTFGETATGIKSATQNPSFCYSIIVSNCGSVELTNVQVNDNALGNLGAQFPDTLAVGQTASTIVHRALSATTTNTVIATGQSAFGIVSDTNTAVAIVVPVSLVCVETVTSPDDTDGNTNDNHVSFSTDGLDHQVTFCTTLTAGNAAVFNVTLTNSSAAGCNLAPFNMAANSSTTICCTVSVNCNTIPPGGLINSVQVSATAGECANDSAGNIIKAISTCEASVVCIAPPGCRTTGGGRQPKENTCPQVTFTTHGGQVGAPFAQSSAPDCATGLGFNNPCIRGEYQHVRHGRGGNFHAASNGSQHDFDSLMCACLPCDHTDIPSTFGGCHPADRVYASENPTQPGKHFGLCNPGDRICGPEPRHAPANKICFSGVADYIETTGKRTPHRVVFRVDLEDRSEPGGAQPKGGKAPPDRYRMRMWFIDPAQVDSPAVKALRATVACKNALTEVIPATLDCLGSATPAPDIDDGGDLDRGNRQIHPNTGATCD